MFYMGRVIPTLPSGFSMARTPYMPNFGLLALVSMAQKRNLWYLDVALSTSRPARVIPTMPIAFPKVNFRVGSIPEI